VKWKHFTARESRKSKNLDCDFDSIKIEQGLGLGFIKCTFEASKWQSYRREMAAVRQLFCLQGHFALRAKPFWRPQDLTHFA
jgi:hypothetical protein